MYREFSLRYLQRIAQGLERGQGSERTPLILSGTGTGLHLDPLSQTGADALGLDWTLDLDEALRLGNRIAILKDGELVQEGTPEDILLNPANDYVQSFLQDVNRTTVLNATHAGNPARLTLTMRSRPAHALDRMRAMDYEYAPVLDGKRLAGVLTAKAAEEAIQQGARDVSRFVEDLASVPATAGLGEVRSSSW
ncbi:hypothetical protein G6F58_012823 [Rhizopus delemar]|nr:hypothetical protein G6F58_012823 [Rhizopus delemar]